MEIRKVETDQKRYLDLLLLANEQEDMVDQIGRARLNSSHNA